MDVELTKGKSFSPTPKPINKTDRELTDHLYNLTIESSSDPRSPEFKAGVLATLKYRCEGMSIECPYNLGTAEADAFIAGIDGGNKVWFNYMC
jgi:hypothetical protein